MGLADVCRLKEKQGAMKTRGRRYQGLATKPESHPTSHRVRVKARYTKVRKGGSTESKDSYDNLRKAGKK